MVAWNRQEIPGGQTHRFDTGEPILCQMDELGMVGAAEVLAITDAAGPQVIVIGSIGGKPVHLLSKPFKDHAGACELGREIVKAKRVDVYGQWYNLQGKSGVGANLMAVFGGPFRETL